MNKPLIYALDFDGVICDSAVETAITGWKAATHMWPDMVGTIPTEAHIEQFRSLRPQLETGYEAIVLMRLLQQGESVANIQANMGQFIDHLGEGVALLKTLFGQTRDQWIKHARDEWIIMNPLFAGISDKLQQLQGQPWYIVTTKQERFVEQILAANQVSMPDAIYGLDRKMSKTEVLQELVLKHADAKLCFIEDRLATLLTIADNKSLSSVELQLVDWGYNIEQDRNQARESGFQVISLPEFLT